MKECDKTRFKIPSVIQCSGSNNKRKELFSGKQKIVTVYTRSNNKDRKRVKFYPISERG